MERSTGFDRNAVEVLPGQGPGLGGQGTGDRHELFILPDNDMVETRNSRERIAVLNAVARLIVDVDGAGRDPVRATSLPVHSKRIVVDAIQGHTADMRQDQFGPQ